MTYHVGFTKRGQTLIIQACHCVDYLSCELYDYMGQRVVTKAHLREHRYSILAMLKKSKPEVYAGLKYAVVE